MITLSDLLAYNRWANHQYLDALARLNEEQFLRKLGGSFGSIRETLVHLAWAEWLWSERWQGKSPQSRATPERFPTADAVRSYLEDVEQVQARVLEGGGADLATARIRYTNLRQQEWEYTLEQMVHHLVMHSAYHRGQLATLLRQLNLVPPTTDYLVHVDMQKGAGA